MDNTSDLNQIYEKTKTTGSPVDLDNLILEQAKHYYKKTPDRENQPEKNYVFSLAASFTIAVIMLFFLTKPKDKPALPIEVASSGSAQKKKPSDTTKIKKTSRLPADLGFPFQNDFNGKIQPACKAKFPGLEKKIIVKKTGKEVKLTH